MRLHCLQNMDSWVNRHKNCKYCINEKYAQCIWREYSTSEIGKIYNKIFLMYLLVSLELD